MDSGLASAFSAFGTKYIETMYSLPSATAALYYGNNIATSSFVETFTTEWIYFAGATVVAFACSGNVLSGFLVTKFNMTVPQMIKFSIVATAVSLCCVFVFMIYCPTPGNICCQAKRLSLYSWWTDSFRVLDRLLK